MQASRPLQPPPNDSTAAGGKSREMTAMTLDTSQASGSPAAEAPTPGDLLDVDQAAERLGTPVRFVRRLIAERRIRFYKIGRYVRIDRHDLDRFVEDARIDPPESPSWAPAPR